MEFQERFFDNCFDPENEVGSHKVHQSKMWNSITLIKVESWVQNYCQHLEDGEDNCKEAVDGSNGTNTVNVENMRGKGDKEVEASSSSENSGTLSEKSTPMRFCVAMGVRWLDEVGQEVDQEYARDHQHVQQEVACLQIVCFLF